MTRKNKPKDWSLESKAWFLNDSTPGRVPATTAILEALRPQGSASSQHAALMRARRDRPEIVEAIIAVRGHNNPDNHRYTVAARILPGVNAWLKEHGYKPVLRKALAGRIAHT
jgi:hypothetical protein